VLYWPETTRFYAEAGPRGIPRTVLLFASLPAPTQIQRNAIFLPVPRAAAELDAVNCVQTRGRAAARKRWTQHSSRQIAWWYVQRSGPWFLSPLGFVPILFGQLARYALAFRRSGMQVSLSVSSEFRLPSTCLAWKVEISCLGCGWRENAWMDAKKVKRSDTHMDL